MQVVGKRMVDASGAQAHQQTAVAQQHVVGRLRRNTVALIEQIAVVVVESVDICVLEPQLHRPVADEDQLRRVGGLRVGGGAVQRKAARHDLRRRHGLELRPGRVWLANHLGRDDGQQQQRCP
jgi:hypothetical protein